ncbi:MAG: hypothetical protein KZQ95_04370 [Candidatus Thiodiazotropha sp. (ex Epidulcina cf. delphinae)]|nr:hypothetical protein [Candidatus Thiodiazotropha sp. (ex Epidulcina cf. delphinae)]
MTLAKTLVAKLVIASLALFVSSPLWAADHGFCEAYARQALTQFEEAQGEGCENLNYPVWSVDFRHHYDWCRKVPPREAEKGGELRAGVLRQCRGSQGRITGTAPAADPGAIMGSSRQRACRDYADSAVSQQRRNLAGRCGFQGPQWNGNPEDHYNWCLHGENLKRTEAERLRREEALASCGAAPRAPSPAKGQGSGGRGLLPIPPPVLDPGVGDQPPRGKRGALRTTPFRPLDTARAQAIAAPTGRRAMVNSLLADSATRAAMQTLPDLRGVNPQTLAHQTLGGSTMAGQTLPAVGGGSGSTATTGYSPASGPRSPRDFAWDKGIHFSPFTPPPTYFKNGRDESLGEVEVGGALVANNTMELMNRQKLVYLGFSAHASLNVDLPRESATYMFSIKLANGSARPDARLYQGANAPIKAFIRGKYVEDRLTLAPLSDGSGFVAIVKIQPQQMYDESDFTLFSFMDHYSASLFLTLKQSHGFAFGGFTITRL